MSSYNDMSDLADEARVKYIVCLDISKVFGTVSDNILTMKLMDNEMNWILVEQTVPEDGDQ